MLVPQRFETRPQGRLLRQIGEQARRSQLKHHADLEQLQREVLRKTSNSQPEFRFFSTRPKRLKRIRNSLIPLVATPNCRASSNSLVSVPSLMPPHPLHELLFDMLVARGRFRSAIQVVLAAGGARAWSRCSGSVGNEEASNDKVFVLWRRCADPCGEPIAQNSPLFHQMINDLVHSQDLQRQHN
jgi:hypothetical protein